MNVELSGEINIFYGNNAEGKTSLLEAIYLCATGRSPRTHNDKELIMHGKAEAHARLTFFEGEYLSEGSLERIDVHLKREGKKGIAVNGVPVLKLSELFGTLYMVFFSPEDLFLIKNGPSERRRFLDMELCQLSKIYYYELKQYYKVLNQRNSLLKKIQWDKALKDTLFLWDEQLVAHGENIILSRRDFVKRLNNTAKDIYHELTLKENSAVSAKEILDIKYKPNVEPNEFLQKLKRSHEKDISYGSTGWGIHKDDIIFSINDTEVKTYGSQGQQRTAALAAKLAEIELIKEEKGKTPVLLLDDVLSELDSQRQSQLLARASAQQTIITCTDAYEILNKLNKNKISLYQLSNGLVQKI